MFYANIRVPLLPAHFYVSIMGSAALVAHLSPPSVYQMLGSSVLHGVCPLREVSFNRIFFRLLPLLITTVLLNQNSAISVAISYLQQSSHVSLLTIQLVNE